MTENPTYLNMLEKKVASVWYQKNSQGSEYVGIFRIPTRQIFFGPTEEEEQFVRDTYVEMVENNHNELNSIERQEDNRIAFLKIERKNF